jgi:hypothetical protein
MSTITITITSASLNWTLSVERLLRAERERHAAVPQTRNLLTPPSG